MSNQPENFGCIDPDDWGELLAELWESNPKVQASMAAFESECRNLYRNLRQKGYHEEDIREILFMTDISCEIMTACADATVEAVQDRRLEVCCKAASSDTVTPRQEEYLKMLKAKYSTTSGCLWGSNAYSPE